MGKTRIEWTQATWNPVTGCSPVSPGCAHCYAARMAKRLAGRFGYPDAPHEFEVTLHQDRLEEPLRWKRPRMVFVCSMSDLFHESLALGHIEPIFEVIKATPQHTYQILTKRPERMAFALTAINLHMNKNTAFKNLWIGVTVENQEQAEKRIPVLLQIPAAVRFVSVEPMLGPVDFSRVLTPASEEALRGVQWVICGGETGPGARPMDPVWVYHLRDQCSYASVPFFFKSWGDYADAWNIPDDVSLMDVRNCASVNAGETTMFHVGKRAAGRMLNGRTWDEFPTVGGNLQEETC